MFYYLWTEGCQMNASDSQRVAGTLEAMGYRAVERAEEADVIVLNTCVVRQSAEDKAFGRLTSLKPIKKKNPAVVVNLMGCMVGRREPDGLRGKFPYVDVFSPPSDPRPLVEFLLRKRAAFLPEEIAAALHAPAQDDLAAEIARFPHLLPGSRHGLQATALVPAVLGCSYACTYCIIPHRRGPERSRPEADILAEIRRLVEDGVREVTLLGQIVDRYGMDSSAVGPRSAVRPTTSAPSEGGLPRLLRRAHEIDGLARIRFLTSHPNWMTEGLLQTVAGLPKVCEHIEIPVQSGDDEVLERMRRGYTAADFRRLIRHVREALPGASIATDVIVGFPGETEGQFLHTRDLLAELRLDTVHLARYSPRPKTYAARNFPDDVPPEEKRRRFRILEDLQTRISAEKNAAMLGRKVEVLVEGKHKGRWHGRTRTNRPVFFDDDSRDWHSRLATVEITRASAWSLQGNLVS
jgi:tRNA-2-methylthio-N6-dimethylallyladenosine synthase